MPATTNEAIGSDVPGTETEGGGGGLAEPARIGTFYAVEAQKRRDGTVWYEVSGLGSFGE